MKKRLIIIIYIIVTIGIIVGITFAFFRRDIFSQNVSFTTQGITVTYSAGNNISGIKLIPVSTLQKGLTDGTAIEKTITVSSNKKANFNLYMDIQTLDSGLKYSYVVWQIKKDNNVVNSGNFANSNAGDTINLLSNEEINSTTSTYTLNIWIDGSVDNSENVENQNYSFVLRATASDELSTTTLAQKVISLSQGDSWESGANGVYQTNGHEYRYIGANVDNWVRFNDDDYRIIGVFDENSHGQPGQNLVKLIAANPLGGYTWGITNVAPEYTSISTSNNNWETANVNIILNEYFLNATDISTTYGSCSNWSYSGIRFANNYVKKDCSDIIGYGIQTTNLRNYIQPVTWYLKGYSTYNFSKQDYYICERSDSTTIENCTSGNSGEYATKVENKSIGLMYVSDFVYASGYYSSIDTTVIGSDYFGVSNWLHNGWEWTITPRGNTNNGVIGIRMALSFSTLNDISIRPTFYLKSTIKFKSGDGSINNPYIIE